MSGETDIEWEKENIFGSINPRTNINYEGDWKYYVATLADKKKLDRIATEIFQKYYYCLGYKAGAKVEFVDRFDADNYEYEVGAQIYNIPSKEDVIKVYDYIKKKCGRGFFTHAAAAHDKKYKYILDLDRKGLYVPISVVQNAKVSHKHKGVSGTYDYKTAVKRFGDFGKIVDKVFSDFVDECAKVDDEYDKKYRITVATARAEVDLVYHIIKIPPDKLEGYVSKLEENIGSLEGYIDVIDRTSIKIVIESGEEM
ncbi:MAG: hypothetical protein ACP5KS_02995 [Candidatus Hydrogenedens sp.]